MDIWKKKDQSPREARNVLQRRAVKMLRPLSRLVRQGHKQEALDKIAGAVADGVIRADDVTSALQITAGELNKAVESYRQTRA